MRKMKWLALVGLAAGAFALVMSTVSCEEITEACGPCGTIEAGDTTISGDARLDGFFKAVSNLDVTTNSIKVGMRANVEEMALAFGLGTQAEIKAMSFDDLVADLTAEIEADLQFNVSGGLRVKYEPPRCSANVAVAVEAQAQCEVKADCDVDYEPGELSVTCEGKCTGGCSGSCEGECIVEASGTCGGGCRGTCELELGGQCDGTCHGECSAGCTLVDANGDCKGECSGTCTGSCELSAEADCSGTCHGECNVGLDVDCSAKCEGECSGECSGSCEGTATPPSVAVDCDASAECKASASAQASASLECSPPTLEIDWDFNGSVTAEAKAEFIARMKAYKVGMVGVIKGMFEAEALWKGDVEAGIEPPITTIAASIDAIISGGIDDFDIAIGLIPCVIPAFEDSADAIVSVGTDLEATYNAAFSLFGTLDI